MEPPVNPAGPYEAADLADLARRAADLQALAELPAALGAAVAGLDESQLDTRYRNWTIRQIVHHLADSHMNALIRCRWTLTEDHPTIKPYDETRWAELSDARLSDVAPSLALITGLHARWVRLLQSLDETEWNRTFFHPEGKQVVRLAAIPGLYAWHGRHHTAQILWRREQAGWSPVERG